MPAFYGSSAFCVKNELHANYAVSKPAYFGASLKHKSEHQVHHFERSVFY